jgi:hypothetical protein
MHLFGGFGDVEVGVGEGADRFDGRGDATPSTVAPPKPNIGLISAAMAAGSRDGVDASLRAASCSGVRVSSSEATLDRSCSIVRARMSVEMTRGGCVPRPARCAAGEIELAGRKPVCC